MLKSRSVVLEHLPADAEAALSHFRDKLAFETDPSDVFQGLQDGETGFIVVDARSPEAFAREHIPGAINMPHRQMNEATTASLPRDKVYVVYCDGVGCNASTKGSANLSALGFRVKELMGGIDWWKKDGYSVEPPAQQGSDSNDAQGIGCTCG
jgi:rhodanese-related sulfurtransferase